jgi:hypothetical protein
MRLQPILAALPGLHYWQWLYRETSFLPQRR